MRFITSLQGSVAVKFSPDEAAPPQRAVLTRDLIDFLGRTYSFSLKPEVPPGLIVNPYFVFQTGEVIFDGKKFPINQLTMMQGGAVLTARDTDTADLIFNEIVKNLDQAFDMKIGQSIRARYYVSNMVVEFEPGLEKKIAAFDRANTLLNEQIPRKNFPFLLKRLAFGSGDVQLTPNPFAIDDIPNMDFTIERRAGEPYSSNRYFSGAPISTREHKRVLEMLERTMAG